MRARAGGPIGYQIADEPRHPPLTRVAIPPLALLPLTIWCALSYSPLFLLLPGANGLLVWGNQKWRDLGLALLSLLLFVVGSLAIKLLWEMALLHGLGLDYARDVVLALAVSPAIKVVIDQNHTIELRQALQS